MYVGVKTCEYFEMKQYSWQGLAEIPTLKGKMKRTMQQFTPKSWTKFEWDSTKSFKSYCTVIFLLTMVSVCDRRLACSGTVCIVHAKVFIFYLAP